jgi:hypothetical protein
VLKPKLTLVVGAALCLAACSGFAEFTECTDGETAPCESPCGQGTMTCEAGTWSACQLVEAPECQLGESGTCMVAPDEPPGLWFCSDTCEIGPCIRLCNPGDTVECDAACGPGQVVCQDDGTWSDCLEYVIPTCRLGDVEICRTPEGAGYWRCTEECEFGPCDSSLACFPGETVQCDRCAAQECQADGTWGECVPHASVACSPGETQVCQGPCGPGTQICSDSCQWSDCLGMGGGCIPGQRQVCPSSYCGVSFRVCGPGCVWTDCIEAGY